MSLECKPTGSEGPLDGCSWSRVCAAASQSRAFGSCTTQRCLTGACAADFNYRLSPDLKPANFLMVQSDTFRKKTVFECKSFWSNVKYPLAKLGQRSKPRLLVTLQSAGETINIYSIALLSYDTDYVRCIKCHFQLYFKFIKDVSGCNPTINWEASLFISSLNPQLSDCLKLPKSMLMELTDTM